MIDHTFCVPSWIGQLDILSPGMSGAAADEFCDGYMLAEQVYGRELPKDSGIAAFAYLWRRFGPPFIGGDDYKELALYVLTTPHPDIFVTIRPGGNSLAPGIGYLITREYRETACAADAIRGAVKATLAELLRPVYVRDVALSILGNIPPEGEPFGECVYAERSPYAGHRVPKAAMDAEVARRTAQVRP